jgi:hypothetical protein
LLAGPAETATTRRPSKDDANEQPTTPADRAGRERSDANALRKILGCHPFAPFDNFLLHDRQQRERTAKSERADFQKD